MKMGSLYPALALTVLAAVLPASTNTVPLEAAFQGNKSYKDPYVFDLCSTLV